MGDPLLSLWLFDEDRSPGGWSPHDSYLTQLSAGSRSRESHCRFVLSGQLAKGHLSFSVRAAPLPPVAASVILQVAGMLRGLLPAPSPPEPWKAPWVCPERPAWGQGLFVYLAARRPWPVLYRKAHFPSSPASAVGVGAWHGYGREECG